jgi:hypothetical protein
MFQPLVPDPLQDQTDVNEYVVGTDCHLPLCLVCEQCSQEVSQITQTPLHQEEYGQPRSTLEAVVLIYLWYLCKEP